MLKKIFSPDNSRKKLVGREMLGDGGWLMRGQRGRTESPDGGMNQGKEGEKAETGENSCSRELSGSHQGVCVGVLSVAP